MTTGTTVVPLITCEDGLYRLHPATAEWLAARTRPFAVLAFAGKFRTGKSYVLNRLLRREAGKGFGVGETVQACTRGIWLCQDPISDGDMDVFVLDTEGIDALDAESDHDVRIVGLALLLCSAFAYNSMSHLDEAAVQTLGLMARVAAAIGADDDGDGAGPGAQRPSFYWVLRDFSLQLVDAEGKPITHTQYLDQALETPAGASAKCATRDAVKTLFPERHLVTLPRPGRGDSAQKLDARGAAAMSPKFERFLDTFRKHVCAHAQPVRAAGVPLSGRLYVEHARALVDRVNANGALPRIRDAWTLLSGTQHAEAEEAARARLVRCATDDCPVGDEGALRLWVEDATDRELSAVRFVPPEPDVAAVRNRLVEAVLHHCVHDLDRVRDVCAEAAEVAVAEFERAGFRAPQALLLPPPSAPHLSTDAFLSRVTERLVASGTLDRMHNVCVQAGRDEIGLRMRSVEADLVAAIAALNEERASRRADDDAPADREHGSTQTPEEWVVGEASPMAKDADRERFLVDLEANLHQAADRARVAEERAAQTEDRSTRMATAFEANMDELKRNTVRAIGEAQRERDAAIVDRDARHHQRQVLEGECEKARSLARDAQERALEVHRTTLEDLRRRDEEARLLSDTQHREASDLLRRADAAEREVRGLKRRVDELLDVAEEAKRLREEVRRSQVEGARTDAERDALRSQVQSERAECEALRRARYDLEGRIAVLDASAKLESCRRAIGS